MFVDEVNTRLLPPKRRAVNIDRHRNSSTSGMQPCGLTSGTRRESKRSGRCWCRTTAIAPPSAGLGTEVSRSREWQRRIGRRITAGDVSGHRLGDETAEALGGLDEVAVGQLGVRAGYARCVCC